MTERRKGFLDWYFKPSLLLRILIGLVAGAIVGLIVGPRIVVIKPLGDLLIRLLNMIIVPVIFFSLITAAASIAPSKLGRVGIRIFVYYMATTVVAIAIGLLFGNIFKPGLGLSLVGTAPGKELTAVSMTDTFLNIVPKNPAAALANGDVLPIIFFALVFGITVAVLMTNKDDRVKEGATLVYKFCNGAAETMYKLTTGVLQYAPVGVFALIAVVLGQNGAMVMGPLALVTVAVYIALATHVLVTYGGVLAMFKLSLWKFIARAKEAMIMAFVTRSSNGTLPLTMKVSEEKLGIPRGIGAFTLPLGATINMDGTAIYLGVCAMFIANAVGVPLTFSQQLIVIVTATLASIGTAGVPGAGAIMLLMVLNSIGLKVDAGTSVAAAYAMIFGIDALLDMGRTSLNVTGDMVGSSIVAKTEGELDLEKWKTVKEQLA
jgi:Na+/H+-dicarboxylate symporter